MTVETAFVDILATSGPGTLIAIMLWDMSKKLDGLTAKIEKLCERIKRS